MKRDMELMKSILQVIEEAHNGLNVISNKDIDIEGYSFEQIFYHTELLYEAGLVSEFKPSRYVSGGGAFLAGGLTNEGHDFLELIRNPEIWDKTKEEVEKRKLPKTIEYISKIAGIFTGNLLKEINS